MKNNASLVNQRILNATHINNYNNFTISDENKEAIYMKLLSLNIDNKDNRKTHVQSIYNDIKEKNNKITVL